MKEIYDCIRIENIGKLKIAASYYLYHVIDDDSKELVAVTKKWSHVVKFTQMHADGKDFTLGLRYGEYGSEYTVVRGTEG